MWFGFMIMEELAQCVGCVIQTHKLAQANEKFEIPPTEALDLVTIAIAFAKVLQCIWPYIMSSNIHSQ